MACQCRKSEIQTQMDIPSSISFKRPRMRWAKSYSIVDHSLLHQGHFRVLSHSALALYLFLVVVGDKTGKSFYAERTIESILRMSPATLLKARNELAGRNLIVYRRPNWWVKTLTQCRVLPTQPRRTEQGLLPIADFLASFRRPS